MHFSENNIKTVWCKQVSALEWVNGFFGTKRESGFANFNHIGDGNLSLDLLLKFNFIEIKKKHFLEVKPKTGSHLYITFR